MQRVQHEFKAGRHHGHMRTWIFRLPCVLALSLPTGLSAAPLPVHGLPAPPTSVAGPTSTHPPVHAASAAKPRHLTLEQAVAQVQKHTGGKVLRAGQRQFGDMIEYRIKVLTPDGHVRVVPVRTHKPPAPRHPSKETH